ncbi:hypothetical protein HWV07_08940 [Natronomonas salina]|uniref:hypothetical protein n=1 Tax=Natronomonas salina TaxID=1710540 RepID=UPI0015B56415|nr:hypothetical protein [Natronomonas salina]QLD89150.1 hypothetical protein HWV07_08940 [Natronomonas salina]
MSDSQSEAAGLEAADENYTFDPEETTLLLSGRHEVSKFDIEDMEKMGLADVELEEVDGETIVTECSFNMTALAAVIGELDVVERKMGDDWRDTSWNPRVRLKYL